MLTNNERQYRFQLKARLNKKVEEQLPPELWPIYRLTNGYQEIDVARVNDVLGNKQDFKLSGCFNKREVEKQFGLATLILFQNKTKAENLILALIFLAIKYRFIPVKSYFAFILAGFRLDKNLTKKLFNLLLFNNNLSSETLETLKALINKQM